MYTTPSLIYAITCAPRDLQNHTGSRVFHRRSGEENKGIVRRPLSPGEQLQKVGSHVIRLGVVLCNNDATPPSGNHCAHAYSRSIVLPLRVSQYINIYIYIYNNNNNNIYLSKSQIYIY